MIPPSLADNQTEDDQLSDGEARFDLTSGQGSADISGLLLAGNISVIRNWFSAINKLTFYPPTASEKMKVIRECALAPCSIQDKASENILNLRRSCDMSKDQVDCFYCCKEDGCNKDAGNHLVPTYSTLLLTLIIMHMFANL